MKNKTLFLLLLLMPLLGNDAVAAGHSGGGGSAPAPAPAAVSATRAAQDTQTGNDSVAPSAAPTTTTASDTKYADQPNDTTQAAPAGSNDPYEGFNRAMFTFNDKLDEWILKPIATGYNKIMPRPLNQGIHNAFNNINTLTTMANDLLQLHFYQFQTDLWRFAINTTIGIGGLFDIAERMGIPYYTNDFGLTMAAWGYEDSNYLVLPFLGPNTIRDGISLPVDFFYLSIYPYIKPPSLRYQIFGLSVIDRRAQLLQFQPVLEEAALDKYVFVRNAYMQRRQFQIQQNAQRTYEGICLAKQNNASGSLPPDTTVSLL